MNKGSVYGFILFCLLYSLFACNETQPPPVTVIAESPEELEKKIPDIVQQALKFARHNNGKLDDSTLLEFSGQMLLAYENNSFTPYWSRREQWIPVADSMMSYIRDAKLFGLFPQDYHFGRIDSMFSTFSADSLAVRDAVLWAKADLMLTDALFHMIRDLKLGRLPQDSMTMRKDSVLTDSFYFDQLLLAHREGQLAGVFAGLEPKHPGYHELKKAIPAFLDSADDRVFTKVPASRKDSIAFRVSLQKRLFEEGFISFDSIRADSAELAEAVKKFQRKRNITIDGRVGDETTRLLNESDHDRFIRIAITLDKYKMLPEQMPSRYVWVNIPGYDLTLVENDSILLRSRIICGKPVTPTPLLTSAISDMITYPQWTIPTSIIVKEILPALKKDTNYLAKKGYSLIDRDGNLINPGEVDWSKYKKGIPYKVVQGSGDENALGILKFNFPNKYAVYLHDTNQRYLFSRSLRSLSHGCVRVQQWEDLANYIVRYDKKDMAGKRQIAYEDSLTTWLARKEKHVIPVRNRLPVFIRYFSCEGRDGRIVFHEDIYGDDQSIRERVFAGD